MSKDFERINKLFSDSCKCIAAIGNETRQSIILRLMEGPNEGMRVGEITKKTHLSRPAVSHHLKVLCDANVITMNKSGTMNFYCLNPDKSEVTNLLTLCQGILDAMRKCESRYSSQLAEELQ